MGARVPLISVLVNSRNAPEYLAPVVRSVLWQSWPNLELIVSEASDGPEGLEILRAFRDTRLVVIEDRDRLGWARGANLGFDKAQGDYVLFSAGDDIYHPRLLETLWSSIQDTGVGTAVNPVRAIDPRGVPTGGRIDVPEWVRQERTWVREFEGNHIVVAMSRRDVLPTPLIEERYPGIGGDWDLWLKLVAAGTGFSYVPEYLFDYRVHTASLVATKGDSRRDMVDVLSAFTREQIEGYYVRSGLDAAVRSEALATIDIIVEDYSRALEYYTSGTSAHLGSERRAFQTGTLLLLLDRAEEAVPLLEGVAKPGAWPEAWNNLGVARRKLHLAADDCFATAVSLFPIYQDAALNRASPAGTWITRRPLRPLDQILR